MSIFNEDTRVKIPATIQFMRFGQRLKKLFKHLIIKFAIMQKKTNNSPPSVTGFCLC